MGLRLGRSTARPDRVGPVWWRATAPGALPRPVAATRTRTDTNDHADTSHRRRTGVRHLYSADAALRVRIAGLKASPSRIFSLPRCPSPGLGHMTLVISGKKYLLMTPQL